MTGLIKRFVLTCHLLNLNIIIYIKKKKVLCDCQRGYSRKSPNDAALTTTCICHCMAFTNEQIPYYPMPHSQL